MQIETWQEKVITIPIPPNRTSLGSYSFQFGRKRAPYSYMPFGQQLLDRIACVTTQLITIKLQFHAS